MTDKKETKTKAGVPHIYTALSEIRKEIPHVSKEGYNENQRYKFLSEAQVTELMKELLTKHNVWFSCSYEQESVIPNQKNTQLITTVSVDYTFTSLIDGSEVTGVAFGQGADSNDKGIYKAVTGAIKYIFMKNFLIVTGDDPESSEERTFPEQVNNPIMGYED